MQAANDDTDAAASALMAREPKDAGERRDEALSGSLAADVLQGWPVLDEDGDELGEVEELLIDLASGRVSHLRIAYGHWLDARVASVPWSALRIDRAAGALVLAGGLAPYTVAEPAALPQAA